MSLNIFSDDAFPENMKKFNVSSSEDVYLQENNQITLLIMWRN